MKCPNCGADLIPVKDQEIRFCPYCGNKVDIPKYEPMNVVGAVHDIAQTYLKQKDEKQKRYEEARAKYREDYKKNKWKTYLEIAAFLAFMLAMAILSKQGII